MNKHKQPPKFKTEAEERKFWEENDSADYLDWSKAEKVTMPNLNHLRRQFLCGYPSLCFCFGN